MRPPFLPATVFVALAIVGQAALAANESSLLARAIAHWDEGAKELAFTQTTEFLDKDGSVKETRIERYDPSRPDAERWQLLSVNGHAPTADERRDIQDKRNRKPRKKALKPFREYVDMDSVHELEGDARVARYQMSVRREAASFFVPIEKVSVVLTIDRKTADVVHIEAGLREPMRIALGLAKVHELDLDIAVAPDDQPDKTVGKVTDSSVAQASVSKFGQPLRFSWSDFKRVDAHNS